MDILVTCKYEEYPIKNEGARVDTTLYSNFSGVGVGILPKFELIQAFMHVLVTCKNEDNQINQRTNGPVNAHLISWPSKAQNIQNLENIC